MIGFAQTAACNLNPRSNLSRRVMPIVDCRGNRLGNLGWETVANALEHVTSLTSLNGCDQYLAIRAGNMHKINLRDTELGVWATRFLERSASTLTKLDVRCS